jgi:hypothetical protein
MSEKPSPPPDQKVQVHPEIAELMQRLQAIQTKYGAISDDSGVEPAEHSELAEITLPRAERIGYFHRRKIGKVMGYIILAHNSFVVGEAHHEAEQGSGKFRGKAEEINRYNAEHRHEDVFTLERTIPGDDALRVKREFKKEVKQVVKSLNAEARKLNKELSRPLSPERAGKLQTRLDEINHRSASLTNGDLALERFSRWQERATTRPKLQQQSAAERIAVRRALAGDEVSPHLVERSQWARITREPVSTDEPLPERREDLPEQLRNNHVAAIVSDIRARLELASQIEVKNAVAKGKPVNEDFVRRVKDDLLRKLLLSNFYVDFGSDQLGLKTPETARLLRQLLLADGVPLDQLFPVEKPLEQYRVHRVRRHTGDSIIPTPKELPDKK